MKKGSIRPIKSLGQNFIIQESAIKEMIDSADLNSDDTILEIGPGKGDLTQAIAPKVKKLIVVEKDARLCSLLKKTLNKNIEIIHKDILKFDIQCKDYKIVANIPFYITSPIIRKFLETENPPKLISLMVQKEVAQRICAKPPKMNILAVSVQYYAKPEIISYIPKQAFYPQPKVDSAIIKIIPYRFKRKNIFFKIVKAGFAHPRKQLINNLSKNLRLNKEDTQAWLKKNKIKPEQRAETLSVEEWINLGNTFKSVL